MSNNLLEVRNLSVTYGSAQPVLRDFSLTLNQGETVGLMGPSGSSKSTVAWAIPRLLPLSARVTGTIRFQGQYLTSLSARQLTELRGRGIAIVAQEPTSALSPFLRIGTQLSEIAPGQTGAILERVGLPAAVARSYPHQVSGGQLQRVVLARTLLCKPKVLIADEPAAAVDRATQTQVFKLIREFQSELNYALLIISHEPAIIEKLASRVIVIKDGQVIEEGAREQIFDHPQAEFTRSVVSLWRS